MGNMKAIAIEIENNPALKFLLHEINELKTQAKKHENDLTGIVAMLAEICHNCDKLVIEKCFIQRYESP